VPRHVVLSFAACGSESVGHLKPTPGARRPGGDGVPPVEPRPRPRGL